jgi:membrane protein
MLFRYIPARHVHWEAIWPAAIFGGMGLELAKAGFTWYVDNLANFQVVYGSITTAIILLLSAYVIASIFLLSAELCAQLNAWVLDQPPVKKVYVASRPVKALPEPDASVE